ncbi:MAG TPA: family 78 glycoside hydrolase catalytic domain [Polyangiaceae bacterium]
MSLSSRFRRRTSLLALASIIAVIGFGAKERSASFDVSPSHLTVNGIAMAVDLDVTPRFGWHVNTDTQTAYELIVASTRAKAEAGTADVCKSGKQKTTQQNDIRYAGPALAASQRYYWKVRTYDDCGRASHWSPVAAFGTGAGASWSNSKPIWAVPASQNWTDYVLTAHLSVSEVALGIRFRSPDPKNGYMWQFRGGDNRLVPHRLVNGTFTALPAVNLPAGTLAIGKLVEVRIEVVASTFKTYIDGVLVNSFDDTTFARGGIGVRTGNSESGVVADLSLVDMSGATLLTTDFTDGDRSISCGTVRDGGLFVPRGSNCLNSGVSVDWAFLRKDFTPSSSPIAWATVYATGTSTLPARQYVYKLFLNGKFVGLGPTRPIGSESRYDGFDVTALLKPTTTNTLAVQAYTTSGQAFQAELVIMHSDGTKEVIGSDGSWKTLSGDSTFASVGSIGVTAYYTAPKENLNARYFPYGFDAPGFDDGAWQNASEKAAIGTLAAAPMAKVEEQLHAPVSIVEKGPGNYFIDFGRTWVGGIKYDVAAGTAGKTIDVRFGEVTSAENTVRYQLNTGNNYQDIYSMRDGAQTFETWGMRVFRYVEIVGAPEPVTLDNLKALALVYPFDTTAATFTASNADLQSVWQLSKNTIEALNVNFYVDSWTRERADYEADAYLQLQSTLYLADDLSLGRYSIDYFQGNRTWPTEWPLYAILAVYDAWRQTGETQQLRDAYASLKTKLPEAWFEAETQLVRKTTGANGCSSTTNCDIVDWPQTERDGYVFQQYNTVVNALSYRAYANMAEIATAIGEASDAAIYADRANALRTAINSRLYSTENGRYDDGMDASGTLTGHQSLHASAFALAFGVPDEAEAPRVAEYLASRGMACSVYGAAFLIDGLYQAGSGQAALDLLTSTGMSSWMNMIKLGAGATAEAWDPSLKSNLTYSHPWAASPAFVVPSGLFGIRPLEAGYARLQLKPQPGNLEWSTVTVPTVRGTVGAAFDYGKSHVFQLAVQIPGNTSAELSVPVPPGTKRLYVDLVPHAVTSENGYAQLSVSAGCHVVSAERTGEAYEDKRLLSVCTAAPLADLIDRLPNCDSGPNGH